MSYYSTDDECEKSMELLPGTNNEMVPGTEPESTFVFSGNDNDDDSSLSERSARRMQKNKQQVSEGGNNKKKIRSFNHESRHKKKNKVVSPDRKGNKASTLNIKLPDEYKDDGEKYEKMIAVSSNMDSYFCSLKPDTDTWENVRSVVCHATSAYSNLEYTKKQLDMADSKISALEKQIKKLEDDIAKDKIEQRTKVCLDKLCSEAEEELTQVIDSLIWFVQPDNTDSNEKVTYSPRVGPNDYKKFLGQICFQYIFNLSHKFPQKFKTELKDQDMNKPGNQLKVWRYIWKTPEFGKKISTELNNKRNKFVHIAKTAVEVILASRDKLYVDTFLLNLSRWISNPTFSCNEFHFLKDSIFTIIAAEKSNTYHHNNLRSVILQNQSEDEVLYFAPEVVKMLDGVRMLESLSINDVALTCVALLNCIEICVLPQNQDVTDIVARYDPEQNESRNSISQEKKEFTQSSSCSQFSVNDTSEISRTSSWNRHLRTKPKNTTNVYFIDNINVVKENINDMLPIQVFTGGKRYTGGTSGLGHSWTLEGVERYEAIRKQLVNEMRLYKNVHFDCKKKKRIKPAWQIF